MGDAGESGTRHAMLGGRTGLFLLGLGLVGGLSGCAGSGNSIQTITQVNPTAVIWVAAPPTSMAVSAAATLLAATTYPISPGSSGNAAVTYTMTCGTPSGCGTFSASAEGGAVTYTAPSAIPAGTTVTVTATSVADTSLSASAKITIVPPIPIAVSFFATPPASLEAGAQFSMSAGITNDVSANPQVKWAVTCGGTACGSFNPTTTYNEAQTTYTAPTTIPPGGNVAVTVTSVTDPTKSATTSIAITATAATLANGTYVFQIAGQPGPNAIFYTGLLVANNGSITGGEQDVANYLESDESGNYAYTVQETITGGSYATTPDGNLQISIQLGAYGSETLNGTQRSGGQGVVAGIDGMAATGTLDLQTSMAAPTGGYALSLFGGDEYSDPVWIGGVVNIDSAGGISGNGSELDVLDGQVGLSGEDMVGASTVSAPDAYGRVTIKLYPGTGSSLQPVYLAGYIVDATHMRLIETEDAVDAMNFLGVLGGTALGQGANTGKFSTGSVVGTSYVFGAQGTDEHGPLDVAGVLTSGANGTVTGTLNWNDLSGSGTQEPIPVLGAWTVDATGRMTVSNLVSGSSPSYSMHVYLTGDGSGLLLSDTNDSIFAGQVFEQQATTFTAASFSGAYGLNGTEYVPSGVYGELGVEGPLTSSASDGSDAVAGFVDNANGAADFAVSGSLKASGNGVFTGSLAGFTPGTRTASNSFTLYVVDGTQAVAIETDDQQLMLGRLENVE
jgi:hypothetical protein